MSQDQPPAPDKTRCAYVVLAGAPNAGKSTLLNTLAGAKLSIVSPKVQTTRRRVLGILTRDRAQLVVIDTPGIFAPKKRLESAMVQSALDGVTDADMLVLLIDASRKDAEAEARDMISRIKIPGQTRIILALNKIDKVEKPRLLDLSMALHGLMRFDASFMISAEKADGTGDLLDYLYRNAPENPWHYPEDQLSDLNERELAAEITREQIFRQLHEELPYSTTVETEKFETRADGSVHIDQTIYVERDTQKAIVLGKGGARIKQIGTKAREELSGLLECAVHIKLFVCVRENWSGDPERYRQMGLDFPSHFNVDK